MKWHKKLGLKDIVGYLRRMAEIVRSGILKVVKYVNTPLHFFALCVTCIVALLGLGKSVGLSAVSQVVLIALLVFIIVIVTLFLWKKPKLLQFTAEEILEYEKMLLGDSESKDAYVVGSLPARELPKELENRSDEAET